MNDSSKSAHKPYSEGLVKDHYVNLSQNYDDYLLYSPQFVRRLTMKMIAMLELGKEDRFLDLGGGTGMYTKDILEQVQLDQKAVLVDPFAEMLAQAEDHDRIECVQDDALRFSAREGTFSKILIKEAVHHVEEKPELFQNLWKRLAPGGRLLLVHVPPDIRYPLFRKALERAASWHADHRDLDRDLKDAGFRVQHDSLTYAHSIEKEKYFEMVRTGYMTVLSSFSDEELEAGIDEMKDSLAGQEILRFDDRFEYILAVKD